MKENFINPSPFIKNVFYIKIMFTNCKQQKLVWLIRRSAKLILLENFKFIEFFALEICLNSALHHAINIFLNTKKTCNNSQYVNSFCF